MTRRLILFLAPRHFTRGLLRRLAFTRSGLVAVLAPAILQEALPSELRAVAVELEVTAGRQVVDRFRVNLFGRLGLVDLVRVDGVEALLETHRKLRLVALRADVNVVFLVQLVRPDRVQALLETLVEHHVDVELGFGRRELLELNLFLWIGAFGKLLVVLGGQKLAVVEIGGVYLGKFLVLLFALAGRAVADEGEAADRHGVLRVFGVVVVALVRLLVRRDRGGADLAVHLRVISGLREVPFVVNRVVVRVSVVMDIFGVRASRRAVAVVDAVT